MTTCGAARRDHHVRVRAVFPSVLPRPGDHLLGVDQVVREPGGRAQAVVGADAHPALARQAVEQGTSLAVLPPAAECSAVEVDEHGPTRGARAVVVHVEQVPPTRVAVADVRDPNDVATAHEERRKQDRAEWQSATEPGSQLRIDGLPPTGTEALAQRTVERGTGLQPPPGDYCEPHCRRDRDAEPDPTDRRVEIALGEGQEGRGKKPVEGHERQLVDQEAEPVAPVRPARLPRPRWRKRERGAHGRQRRGDQIADRHGGTVATDPSPS